MSGRANQPNNRTNKNKNKNKTTKWLRNSTIPRPGRLSNLLATGRIGNEIISSLGTKKNRNYVVHGVNSNVNARLYNKVLKLVEKSEDGSLRPLQIGRLERKLQNEINKNRARIQHKMNGISSRLAKLEQKPSHNYSNEIQIMMLRGELERARDTLSKLA
jgi:hypothetical protein